MEAKDRVEVKNVDGWNRVYVDGKKVGSFHDNNNGVAKANALKNKAIHLIENEPTTP